VAPTALSVVPVAATPGVLPSGGSTVANVSINAVDLGGHNVLATADVDGGAPIFFEWFFERRATPDVETASNHGRYVYALPGFKDITVRVTLADGRRVLGSGAVVVE
jgi:hypothetical protein